MTTDKKIEANRQNALKSTGPTSTDGKNAVRHNALKHGLLSREILLPDEDPELLANLGERLRADLQPVGELEELLMDRIVTAIWRLGRLRRVETSILTWEISKIEIENAATELSRYQKRVVYKGDPADVPFMKKMATQTVELEILDAEKHPVALAKVNEVMERSRTEDTTIGQAFVRGATGADSLSKLSRYEVTIERGLYKALHELQRLQAARAGKDTPLPVAIDIDVSGEQS